MDQQRMRWSYSITDSADMNLSRLWEIVEGRGESGRAAVHGVPRVRHDLETEQQQQQRVDVPERCYGIREVSVGSEVKVRLGIQCVPYCIHPTVCVSVFG